MPEKKRSSKPDTVRARKAKEKSNGAATLDARSNTSKRKEVTNTGSSSPLDVTKHSVDAEHHKTKTHETKKRLRDEMAGKEVGNVKLSKKPKKMDAAPTETPTPSEKKPARSDQPTAGGTDSTKDRISQSISMTSKALSTISIKSKSTKPAQKPNKAKRNKLMPSLPTAKQGDVSSDKDEEEEAWAGIGEQEDEANDDSHLHGFSSDDDDSSDEDMIDEVSVDISKLPTIAKDDSTVALKLEKAKRQSMEDRGVLYLGRIPHGFYEDQMRGYFSQFGTVTRIRLARNKKTGRSKHYGFIEFDSASVAQIVADTMDNYLLMGHILRCKVIPKDEVHPELWIGANRKWRPVPQDRVIRVKHNKPRSEDEQARAVKRLLKRQNERKRKLVEAGIKYDFEAVGYKKVVPAT